MERRAFVTTLLGGAAALAQNTRRQPNIVLVLVDDMGAMDLGCQGSSFYETPEIDRLAREGTRFTSVYSNCPVCSPSRAALMTGRYPHRVHFTGHITATGKHRYPPKGRIIPPDDNLFLRLDEVTIAEALRPAGYVSASIGKWHLGHKGMFPEDQGFDLNVAGYEEGSPPSHFFPYQSPGRDWNSSIPTLKGGKPGEYLTDRLTTEAIGFIEQHRQRPFFLYLPYYAVHTPLEAPPDLVASYERKMQRDRSQKSAVYGAMVESVDRNIGRLRAALERMHLLDNTILVFTSDNGGEPAATNNAPLRAGKGCVYEGGIRVPLILRWPGNVRAGAVTPVPAMGADLMPTLLDLAGVAIPQVRFDGISLKPWLTGSPAGPSRDLFWYYPHYSPQYQQPGAAVRSGAKKLVELYDPPRVELYDLASDPGEKTDLSARLPAETRTLRERLQQHLKATGTILHQPNPMASAAASTR